MHIKPPDISNMHGLGEPHFFSFTVDPKSKIMTSHGIICCSFILPSTRNIKLLEITDDPRLPHFGEYMVANLCRTIGKKFDDLEALISKSKRELDDLNKQIHKLKYEQSQHIT